ncbi:recombinase family protein [Nonomuraea sp. NPDC050451]|uniref:recombinase family protein n=1 Tax=Nonomuraea sp. NPDC050451 TaxID=3364364 RepID=UPI00378B8A56
MFADKKSGKTAERPEPAACHAFLTEGDTLVVPSLDRYGRSLADLITMVGDLRKREIGFTSLHENLDTTTAGGRLIFHVFAALAELACSHGKRNSRSWLTESRQVNPWFEGRPSCWSRRWLPGWVTKTGLRVRRLSRRGSSRAAPASQ